MEADEFNNLLVEAEFAGLGRRRMHLYGRRLVHQGLAARWALLDGRRVAEI